MAIDNTKYINAYIETVMSHVHESTAATFQLKTQLKLANDLIQEKDKVISSLATDKDLILEKDKIIDTLTSEKAVLLKQLEEEKVKSAGIVEKDNIISNLSKEKDAIKAEKDNLVTNLSKEKEAIKVEKDSLIGNLSTEKTKLETELRNCLGSLADQKEMEKVIANARALEADYNAIKNKVSHIDAFSKQIVDMKREIVARDAKIQELTDEINKLNTKKKNKKKPVLGDDF